jgi:hypothetical protein
MHSILDIEVFKIIYIFTLLLFFNVQHTWSREVDSLQIDTVNRTLVSKLKQTPKSYPCHYKQFVIPITLISMGLVGLKSDWLIYQNHEIKNELQENRPRNFPIDNFSQFAPIAAVYGLNLCGIKGIHNFRDRTIIIAAASLMMTAAVRSIKAITRIQRSDGGKNSFPSGHTATAFMSAEYLCQEYYDVSPWIGIAGYAVAAGTGFLRLYNNQHWLTDVIAGAGIGIISTKAAYWLLPCFQRLFSKKSKIQAIAIPQVTTYSLGLGCAITF